MSDDEFPESDNGDDPRADDDPAPDAGEEIPISTGDDTDGTDADGTEADGADAVDNGVEIDIETGSPGGDIEHRGSGDEFENSTRTGGLFDRLDESVVEVLSRALDTETHLRTYVALRRRPWSTADEIADLLGSYPSTVRDALAALESYGVVRRRESIGEASNDETGNDHEDQYAAVSPSVVLTDAFGRTGGGLSDGFDIDFDRYLGQEPTDDSAPVRIDVEDVADVETDEIDETGETEENDESENTNGIDGIGGTEETDETEERSEDDSEGNDGSE